jgi:hypothetical protein
VENQRTWQSGVVQGADAAGLQALCSAYLAADEWGKEHILDTAKRQAEKNPAARLAGPLRLVRSSAVDPSAHLVDNVVNSFPLAVVR